MIPNKSIKHEIPRPSGPQDLAHILSLWSLWPLDQFCDRLDLLTMGTISFTAKKSRELREREYLYCILVLPRLSGQLEVAANLCQSIKPQCYSMNSRSFCEPVAHQALPASCLELSQPSQPAVKTGWLPVASRASSWQKSNGLRTNPPAWLCNGGIRGPKQGRAGDHAIGARTARIGLAIHVELIKAQLSGEIHHLQGHGLLRIHSHLALLRIAIGFRKAGAQQTIGGIDGAFTTHHLPYLALEIQTGEILLGISSIDLLHLGCGTACND